MTDVIAPSTDEQVEPGHLGRVLTPEQRAKLNRISSLRKYPGRDRIIYHEGQDADVLYFLDQGMVELSCQKPDGERHVVAFLHPGDIFGLFEDGLYVNTARTLAPTKLFLLPREALRRLLVEDAQLQLQFLAKASHDLRRAQRQMIVLGERDAHRRLASFLLEFQRSTQFYDPDQRILTLPMSRKDIADYLALSKESVSRALTKLETMGLICRHSDQTIHLQNLRALIALANR